MTFTGTSTVASGALSFYNLSVADGASATLSAGASITGTLQVGTVASTAVFDLAGYSLTGPVTVLKNKGTLRLKGNEGTVGLPAGTIGGTVLYYGDGGATVYSSLAAGYSYTTLSFQTAGANRWNAASGLAVTGSLTINSGTLKLANADSSVTGNVSGAGTLDASAIAGGNSLTVGGYVGTAGTTLAALSAPTGTLSVKGDLDVLSLAHNGGTIVLNGTAAAQTVTPNAQSFYNLTVNSSYATAPQVSLMGAATVAGDLTLTLGTLALANENYSITGNVSGAGTLDASAVAGGNSLTVGGHVGTVGTVLASLSAPPGTLGVGGDWDVSSLTANGGTVAFVGGGTHNLYGNPSFHNLSYTVAGGTLSFESGGVFGVGGAFTVSGALENLTALQGSAASAWTLNNSGSSSVSYAAVSWSTATVAIAPTASLDGGHNTNWNFTVPTITTLETADLDANGMIDALHISFNEPVKDSTVTVSDFSIAGASGESFSSTAAGDTADDADIYIGFAESGSLKTDGTPTLSYTQGTLKDLPGNLMASTGAVAATDRAGPVFSATAPAISSFVNDTGELHAV